MENINYSNEILNKWSRLIEACKNYYIDSKPTGMSDTEFDELEYRAIEEDNFYVRDYVFSTYLKGTKTKNHWIEKIEKTKVKPGKTMLESLVECRNSIGENLYFDLKYDGSSIAIYIDPSNGKPCRIVTVGNLNIDNFGVDQTWKLMSFLPKRFPTGIVAIQCEALIDLDRFNGDPDTARQKANGLINSSKSEALKEVEELLTLRAYRYYTENDRLKDLDYRFVLSKFETVRSPKDGHILFAPADNWTIEELCNNMPQGYTETYKTKTSTGTFLNDGWVVYSSTGKCFGAVKYSGAGSNTELIKTTVRSIQWNDQSKKGKDSWSANVIIDPVTIRGCIIKKPSAGSVSKLINKNITPGSTVSIILANSTIPMIGDCITPGNGDFMWPKCSCGYQLSEKDVYGSLLKCGNPYCTERLNRMKAYLNSLNNIYSLNLNQFLVIDRFKWENTDIDMNKLLSFVENNDQSSFYNYLMYYMKTKLQIRNMELVYRAGFKALRDYYEGIN